MYQHTGKSKLQYKLKINHGFFTVQAHYGSDTPLMVLFALRGLV